MLFKKKVIFVFSLILLLISTSVFCDSKDVEVGFSPGKTAIFLILKNIKKAKIRINIAAYSFTSKSISHALLDAKNKGVFVRVVADYKSNGNRYTAVRYLANNGISVRLNKKYSIMHNKFMVIDDIIVETGSFNYTKNAASRNAENLIVLKDRKVAEKYNIEFERLWSESEKLNKRY